MWPWMGKGVLLVWLRDSFPCQHHHVGMRKGAEVCRFLISSFAAALALCFASPHCFTICSFPRGRLREEQLTEAPSLAHSLWPSLSAEERVLPTAVLQPSTKPSHHF